jgi:hypothetical protein
MITITCGLNGMRNISRIEFRSLFRVKVIDPQTGSLVGYVGDVSENGLKVLTDSPYTPGDRVPMRLRMRVREDETLQFDLIVSCRWSGTNFKTGYFEAGFVLEEPSAEFTLMVERMRIQRNMTEEDQPRAARQ